ncbi:MAG: HAMP domain-containing sensor histidine kinase, partial [Pseudomonadota bacterium]
MSSKPSDGSPTSLLNTDGEALPQPVLRAFDSWIAGQLQPFCLEFDKQYSLRGLWGNAAHFGFSDVAIGAELDELAPYLIGLDSLESVDLRFVTDQQQRHFHLHVLSYDGRFFAIYVDVAGQYNRIRIAQQRSNDTALLYERQNKLVKQLIDASTELDTRRIEAENESKRRQRYMHAMSHDLKAPLQSIMLSIDTLQADPNLTDDSAVSVARLRGALERQVGVLDRLIDEGRSQIEEERVTALPVAVNELMIELSGMFAVFAAEKALRFSIDIDTNVPELVLVDGPKLRRVLINLVGNALKFTYEGFVAVSVAYGGDSMLRISVHDSGPGIALADQKRIFEAYERSNTAEQGSGLGLSIVARLVQHMSGTLSLESSSSAGSNFECRIPAPAVSD